MCLLLRLLVEVRRCLARIEFEVQLELSAVVEVVGCLESSGVYLDFVGWA